MTVFSRPAKQIYAIAWPAISESYLLNLLGFVDAFFIAKLGLVAIDAVGVTNIYVLTFAGVFTAFATSLSVFLSTSAGQGAVNRCQRVVWNGLFLNFALGGVISILSLTVSRWMLLIMGAQGALQSLALPYFEITLGASPLIALFTSQAAAFRAIGDTKTPLYIGIEMNVLHVLLDYVLIFGLWVIPGFGLKGAALATVIARCYAFIRLWQRARRNPLLRAKANFSRDNILLLWKMVKFGVPAAGERLSMRFGQVLYFGLIVRMGVAVYAAHNIAGTITAFASTVGGGFATAATAAIGQAIGSGNRGKAHELYRAAYLQAAIIMSAVTALLCIASPWMGQLFTTNPHVLRLLFIVLAIDIVSQPFLAAVLVGTAAIQVEGNSTYPMIVTAIGIWGIRTLGVYLFAWRGGLGLPAVWASIAADNAFRTLLLWYYRRRKNRQRRGSGATATGF